MLTRLARHSPPPSLRWLPGVGAIVALAVLAQILAGRTYVGPDEAMALYWGQEILHGHLPTYHAILGPAPHPLATAVSALAALLGAGSFTLISAVSSLSFGALVWGTFRLGQSAASRAVGVVAAALLATSYPLLASTAASFVDVPFAALVVWAGVLLLSDRPPALVLGTLAAAGLLRPEAWILSLLYWLYVARAVSLSARLRLAALAIAAPVLWAVTDLIIAGSATYSASVVRDFAETQSPSTSRGSVARTVIDNLRAVTGTVALVTSVVGVALAVWERRSRLLAPGVIMVFGIVTFAGLVLDNLVVYERFLLLPAAATLAFTGFAAMGWTFATRHRRIWMVAGLALLAVLAVRLPGRIDTQLKLRSQDRVNQRVMQQLRALGSDDRAATLLRRCPEVSAAPANMLPYVFYAAHLPGSKLPTNPATRPTAGAFIAPAQTPNDQSFISAAGGAIKSYATPPGFHRRLEVRGFVLYTHGC